MAAYCPGCHFPKSVVLARGREHRAQVGTHSYGSAIDLSSKKSVSDTSCVQKRPEQSDMTLIPYKRQSVWVNSVFTVKTSIMDPESMKVAKK